MADETVKKATAAALTAWRENSGLSQAVVASKLGKSQGTVSRWENGTVTPSGPDVVMLASIYGVGKSLPGLADAIKQAQVILGGKE